MRRPLPRRLRPGLPLRAIAPNVVTALALSAGLTGIRFAVSGDWQMTVVMVMAAGVLDGVDGRIARLLHGESRFGAELDSLSDAIAFGVSPALILYLWSLASAPRFGWVAALTFAIFCALRLARFNAAIDVVDQPHKSAGFLTGVPAPAGAVIVMTPLYLWFLTGASVLRQPYIVGPWVFGIALLMVSSLATFSWSSLRLRRTVRFEALAVIVAVGAALLSAPWHMMIVLSLAYLASIPFSVRAYRRVKRPRGSGPGSVAPTGAA